MNENDVSYRCVRCASLVGSHEYAHTLVVISNTPEGIEKESFAICSKCRDYYVNELASKCRDYHVNELAVNKA